MDFSLTSDQILIRDTVRQFMEAEMRPILREYERADKFPAEQLRRLGELGCCGMLVPEEWGGAGTDTISYVLMMEEVARVCASTAVTLSVTNSVVGVPVWKHGSEAQKKKYLTRLSRGEILGSFCLTEPQSGSDAAALQTRAERRGDEYLSERDQELGDERRRGGRISGFCEDGRGRGSAGSDGVSRRTEFRRLSRQPL